MRDLLLVLATLLLMPPTFLGALALLAWEAPVWPTALVLIACGVAAVSLFCLAWRLEKKSRQQAAR